MADTYVVIIIDDSSDFEYTEEICPRISTLKGKSTLFKNFYTHPVCTLSRTGYMYGSYGKKIGSIDELIPHTWPTHPYPSIASVLTANAWNTCFIGKWHGGVDPFYLENISTPGSHPLNTHPYAMAPLTRGFQQVRAASAGNLGEGGGDYNNWNRLDSTAAGYTVTPTTTYAASAMLTEAQSWLTSTAGTNRFLHFALHLPHAPFHVPPTELLGGYTGNTSTDRGKYLAMLRAADTTVNLLLAMVGLSANVFVWSDNGTPDSVPPSGVDPNRLKRSSFAEGTRVLGVYRRNGVLPSVSPRLMHSIDIGATILNNAGIAIPPEWDGLPFGRTAVLTERQDATEKDRSCRTGCYLYRELTSASSVVTEELYHLPTDPSEKVNVIGNARHAAALAWLRARMAAAAI